MTESLRDRLRRLRRELPAPGRLAAPPEGARTTSGPPPGAGPTSGPLPGADPAVCAAHEPPPPRGDAPAPPATAAGCIDGPAARASVPGGIEIQRRLARRAALVASAAGDDLAPCPAPRVLESGLPARLAPTARGALARTSTFARDHVHGSRALAAGLAYDAELLAASAKDERFAGLDLARAVYLDTETSGLAGGAGTYVFLVGLGTFSVQGFEVWQGFLADPRDERALLAETAERIAAASAIVSFFGKSFDRHRLEDKMRMHGLQAPFAALPHLDLYWPLRRLHGGRFENGRLKTLERELAGVVRADDLPGSFAPAAWFDFLGNRPHRLEGVFRHNLEDVLSLVALLPHAAQPLPQGTQPR